MVLLFPVTQLHKSGRNDDSAPGKAAQNLQSGLCAVGAGIERIVDNGYRLGSNDLQAVLYRLNLADSPGDFLQCHAHFQRHGGGGGDIGNIMCSQKPGKAFRALSGSGFQRKRAAAAAYRDILGKNVVCFPESGA